MVQTLDLHSEGIVLKSGAEMALVTLRDVGTPVRAGPYCAAAAARYGASDEQSEGRTPGDGLEERSLPAACRSQSTPS
jgi:hypothetical protein